MTSRKKKGRRHRKCGYTSKFSEGDIVGVSSQNLKNHWKYFVQKENSTIMLVQLRYVLHILTQGSFLSEIKPFRWSHMTLSFLRKLEKTNSSLLFVKNRFCEVTDNLCDIPPIYLFPLGKLQTLYSSSNKDGSNQNLTFGLQTF